MMDGGAVLAGVASPQVEAERSVSNIQAPPVALDCDFHPTILKTRRVRAAGDRNLDWSRQIQGRRESG